MKVRQVHRWSSIAFTVAALIVIVTGATGREPPQWMYFLPPVPLIVLVITGLYLFVLPYRQRAGR